MASCHTAIVDGYVVEGHVPANDIKTLLKTNLKLSESPSPAWLTVVRHGNGRSKDAYKVMSFDRENHAKVFNSYEGTQ